MIWFDDKGLAHTRVRMDSSAKRDIDHLGMVTSDMAADIGLAPSASGAVLAATPFGENHAKLGLFLFAPVAEGAPPVDAFAVTHHTSVPRGAAVATDSRGTFAAYEEGDVLIATHFDAAAKEVDAPCALALKRSSPRERLGIAATETGAIVTYSEGGALRTRALDGLGCPASPTWTIAQGHWPYIVPLGTGPLDLGERAGPLPRGASRAQRLARRAGSRHRRGLYRRQGPPHRHNVRRQGGVRMVRGHGPHGKHQAAPVRIVNVACIP